MSGLVTAIPTGIGAFTATNIDDLVILTLLFSQVNATFRRHHIVIGQYLGFTALLVASLSGFFGSLILPSHWIGLLGLVPIWMGLSRLLTSEQEDAEDAQEASDRSVPSSLSSFFSPQAYSVAAITIANGSDNVGIYVPLFASCSLEKLLVTLAVFLVLVGVWCYLTYKLTQQPTIAHLLTRYGNVFVPFVLIGLGSFIVLDSAALSLPALVASSLCLLGLVRLSGQEPEVENIEVTDRSTL
jgi:cadmium resistance transport/sequestration family protein